MSGDSASGENLSGRAYGGSRPALPAGSRLQLPEHGFDPEEPTGPTATARRSTRSACGQPREHSRRRLLRFPAGGRASGDSVSPTRRTMLNQQTIEKLYAMRMRGMADAFTQQQEEPQTTQLSF